MCDSVCLCACVCLCVNVFIIFHLISRCKLIFFTNLFPFQFLLGQNQCPVMFKTFTEHSHIVLIATSGNVYSKQAVDEMNIEQKYWNDLLTGAWREGRMGLERVRE